jgi:hypothetical protein
MQTDKITAIHYQDHLRIQSGRIDAINGAEFRIVTEEGHVSAKRAFSCIIEPGLHDSVLFSTDERMQGHILAILERPEDQTTRLDFPGDMTINTANGQMRLNAGAGMSLSTTKALNLLSQDISISASTGLFSIDRLNAIGSTLVTKIGNIQTFAETLETVATHWLQKLKNSLRQIDGLDQLKTRDSLHSIDNLYSMRAKQAAILAKKDIKMDAERIHMG